MVGLVFTGFTCAIECQNPKYEQCLSDTDTLCYAQDIAIINDKVKGDVKVIVNKTKNITISRGGVYVLKQSAR